MLPAATPLGIDILALNAPVLFVAMVGASTVVVPLPTKEKVTVPAVVHPPVTLNVPTPVIGSPVTVKGMLVPTGAGFGATLIWLVNVSPFGQVAVNVVPDPVG